MFDKEISLDADKSDKSIWVCYSMLYDSLGCRFINGAKNMYVFFFVPYVFLKNLTYLMCASTVDWLTYSLGKQEVVLKTQIEHEELPTNQPLVNKGAAATTDN